mgnify:CR=1 FL=1
MTLAGALLLGVLAAGPSINGRDAQVLAPAAAMSADEPVLARLDGLPRGDARKALASDDIDYLGGGWWLAPAGTETGKASALAALPSLWRLDEALARQAAVATAHGDAPFTFAVLAREGSMEAAEAALVQAGARVTSRALRGDKPILGVTVSAKNAAEALASLSGNAAIRSLEPASGVQLLNDNAVAITQHASTTGTPVWDRGIRGEGQVIAMIDSGLDYLNCFFRENRSQPPPTNDGPLQLNVDPSRRKIIAYTFLHTGDYGGNSPSNFDNQGHGTLVAGNAAGSDIAAPEAFGRDNGVAPRAKLVVQDGGFTTFDDCTDMVGLGCPVIDLTPILDQAVALGAHIHNNSYGDRENFFPHNTYTPATADFDDVAWRNPAFLPVAAAGNDGQATGAVASPSVGKNILSVGATASPSFGGSANNIASFSSWGFASDGRVKPDVTAPGQTFTASLGTACSVRSAQGTSMASPVAAGTAALARQYFTEGWHPSGTETPADGFVPSAALLKAVLINGAVDMSGVEGPPPNRAEGWGRVHLERSLYFDGDPRRVLVLDAPTAFMSSADAPFTIAFRANGNAAADELKVTLVWTDPPASPLATIALVNNLDLRVDVLDGDNAGASYRGNAFDAGGFSVPGAATSDTINNVEQVVLAAGTEATCQVTITPSSIIDGPQPFALAVGGDVEFVPASGVEGWMVH